MRFVTYLSCIAMTALLFSACKQKSTIVTSGPAVAEDSIKGTYSGDFKGSPIALTIRYISGKHVSGYNVHKGLKRNMTGTMVLEGTQLHFHLSEPGTNKYDGVFDFLVDTTNWKGKGTWKPISTGNEVAFTLQKQKEKDRGEEFWNWGIFRDTLSSYHYLELKSDKSCVYSYVLNDSASTAQEIRIPGTYTVNNKDSTIIIDWQPNDIFPSRKSVFTVHTVYQDPEREYPPERRITILGREFMQYFD